MGGESAWTIQSQSDPTLRHRAFTWVGPHIMAVVAAAVVAGGETPMTEDMTEATIAAMTAAMMNMTTDTAAAGDLHLPTTVATGHGPAPDPTVHGATKLVLSPVVFHLRDV